MTRSFLWGCVLGLCLTSIALYAQITGGGGGAGGGGGGTPANPTTSIQFNNAGSFGGSANLTWDGTLGKLNKDFTYTPAVDVASTYVGSFLGTNIAGTKDILSAQGVVSYLDVQGSVTGAADNGYFGISADAYWGSSGTSAGGQPYSGLWAGSFYADVYGGGTLVNAGGVYINANVSSGIVTNLVGIAVDTPDTSGTVANVYGLRIYDQTGGDTATYAIYTGAGLNRFGDSLIVADGKALQGDTTSGHTYLFNVYDTNTGPGYVTWGTVTGGNTPAVAIAPPVGGTTIRITANYSTAAGDAGTLAVANVGANSCGTSAASIAGNNNAFEITVGATAGTQCRVAFTRTATNRWDCVATDSTTTIATRATYVDTTHVDFLGAFVAGDVVTGVCFDR